MDIVQELIVIIWNHEFWLPAGLTWKDFGIHTGTNNARHLYLYPIPFAACLLLFRFALQKYCFRRLGGILGIKSTKNKKVSANPVLERAYAASNPWTCNDIMALAKHTDYSERKIERWFRLRQIQNRQPTLYKFSESCWSCFYYSCSFICGLVIIWTKPWFWNLDLCWVNFPLNEFSIDIWWYYMITLSFYWSLFILQLVDTKRKDFWPMCLHHFTVIAGKASVYAKRDRLRYFFFVCFVISWCLSRLVYYPFWLMHSTLFRSVVICGSSLITPPYFLMNGLIVGLFIIHVYYSYLIFKLAVKIIASRKFERDIRSESDGDSDEGDD